MLNLILWPRSAGMEEVLFMAEFYCSWMILCHKFFQIHPNFSKRTGPITFLEYATSASHPTWHLLSWRGHSIKSDVIML